MLTLRGKDTHLNEETLLHLDDNSQIDIRVFYYNDAIMPDTCQVGIEVNGLLWQMFNISPIETPQILKQLLIEKLVDYARDTIRYHKWIHEVMQDALGVGYTVTAI